MHHELPDFDTLRELAENDPEALESLRLRLCNQLIESAPTAIQRRLRGIQFQVDAQRRIAKTPMQSCIRISEIMHGSLLELRDSLTALSENSPTANSERSASESYTATVLQFQLQSS